MIRLIIFALGVFVIWVLFISTLTKKRKIIISLLAVAIGITGFWYEQRGQTPNEKLISVSQIEQSNLRVVHSYRSNFDFNFVIKNNADNAIVKRLVVNFIAQLCDNKQCTEIETVEKGIPVVIPAGTELTKTVNVRLDKVADLEPEKIKQVEWQMILLNVLATPQANKTVK